MITFRVSQMQKGASTVSDSTFACINYVLNHVGGVVRVGQPVYQFI